HQALATALNTYLVAAGLNVTGTAPSPAPSDPTWTDPQTLSNVEAARAMEQMTWGSSPYTLPAFKAKGITAWVNEQLAMPLGRTDWFRDFVVNYGAGGYPDTEPYVRAALHAIETKITFGNDPLRVRCMQALQSFWVVSALSVDSYQAAELAQWYDVLRNNTFGNYRDLIAQSITSRVMAKWLTFLRNNGVDPSSQPDENFARELLQLFTIGKSMLNIDGSFKLDSNGKLIPTYTNAEIQGHAKVLTGWSNHNQLDADTGYDLAFRRKIAYEATGQGPNNENATLPMAMYGEYHSKAYKQLVNGNNAAAYSGSTTDNDAMSAYGLAETEQMTNIIFNHPNVGPYVATCLLKMLIRSTPSPEYISRVARKFNDNGQGVRGDMKAVFRQIFLDPEARDMTLAAADGYGKAIEFYFQRIKLNRFLGAANAYGIDRGPDDGYTGGQSPMQAPSVFYYFSPEWVPQGEDRVMPELQMYDDSSVAAITMAPWTGSPNNPLQNYFKDPSGGGINYPYSTSGQGVYWLRDYLP
ncbi:MAG: DUF1800 family protein, partial [Proteobacteria bacterium]